jgi:hypothetical protein
MKQRYHIAPVNRPIALFVCAGTLLVSLLAAAGARAVTPIGTTGTGNRTHDALETSNILLSLADPWVGCLPNVCSKETLFVSTDRDSLVNLQLVIKLPNGLVVDLPTIYADPVMNGDPRLLHAYWLPLGGDSILLDMAWGPPYSTGDPSQRIASLALRNVSALTGTYPISCLRSLWVDPSGGLHPNDFTLGAVIVKVDCQAPEISSVSVNRAGASQSCPNIANRFSATLDRGPTPGDSPLQQAWVTFSPGNATFILFDGNPGSNPYTLTFPDTARCTEFLNDLGETCSILTLHVIDAECNTTDTLLADLCDHPLSVELVTFEAYSAVDGVRLNFALASENNNDHFEIWRSTGRDQPFSLIARIRSQGNSSAEHRYDYLDRTVTAGQTYGYYLADVDVNGVRTEHRGFVRFATFAAATAMPATYDMTAYPNPFNPSTTIAFTLPESQSVQVAVFDVSGRRVCTLASGKHSAGTHQVLFDGAGLPSGIYMAQIRCDAYARSEKLLLLK